MLNPGDATVALINNVLNDGVSHAVLLLRHSARTFHKDIHDLDNQLTAQGREMADRLGSLLPADLTLRGYASPAQRCVETAEHILRGYREAGGAVTRTRPVEAFGVFYALDQQRMWKGMSAAGGMVGYVEQWFAGKLPSDAMLSPGLAASLVCHVMCGRLDNPIAQKQLDVCVTHDLTVHLVREALLGQRASSAPVEFLDGLLLYRQAGKLKLMSHHGPAQVVTNALRMG